MTDNNKDVKNRVLMSLQADQMKFRISVLARIQLSRVFAHAKILDLFLISGWLLALKIYKKFFLKWIRAEIFVRVHSYLSSLCRKQLAEKTHGTSKGGSHVEKVKGTRLETKI